MKVTVTLTIDVDPEAWDLTYGSGPTPAEVRTDVKSYALNQLQGSAAAEEGAIVGVVQR